MSISAEADGLKLAERIAEQVETRILEIGWPVGEVIGSEQSLMEEYGVSRGVLREAIRLLEHHGTARMRRGPGGGLAVSIPDRRAIRRSAAVYLRYRRTDVASLSEARKALELNCLGMVNERMHEPGVTDRLVRILNTEAESVAEPGPGSAKLLRLFHLELAELSGNSVMSLFSEILMELQSEFTAEARKDHPAGEVTTTDVGASHRAHHSIYEALAQGELEKARRRMVRHLDGIAAYIVDQHRGGD